MSNQHERRQSVGVAESGSDVLLSSVYDSGALSDALIGLRRELAQIDDLVVAARVLEWDQLVMMPRGGVETRAESLATLNRFAHELFIRDEIGELLERLGPEEADLDPESDDACLIAVTRRDWEKARRIPPELRGEMTKVSSEGMEAWADARANDDFASFRVWLDRTLELKHRYIECFPDGRPVRPAPRRLRAGHADRRGAPGLRPPPACTS